MKIRRCAVLYIEPREALDVDWSALFSGATALLPRLSWIALAPHLGREIEIDTDEVQALGRVGQTLWMDRAEAELRIDPKVVARLLELGLLLGDWPDCIAARARDEVLRSQHWRGLSALAHTFSRWENVGADTGMEVPSFQQLLERHGAPPPPTIERAAPDQAITLPVAAGGALDEALFGRYTGRNFDPQAVLPLALAARLLQRTFGAQELHEVGEGGYVLKKFSPSAGALHPIEAYVLAQRIDGVAPGLYHYHCARHTLEPLQSMDSAAASALALQLVADQYWFADAPMLVVMAARVERNFWKYRNHQKAYKALMLDAGHLSQTFYLLASEAGMPAFITAAINDVEAERACGLDYLCDAVIALCGCGPAAAGRKTIEMRYGQSELAP